MRWAFAVVLVVATATVASAKPRPRDMDLFDAIPPPPCGRAKTWPLAKRCLDKTGTTAVIYETDDAKVITVAAKGAGTAGFKQILLYAKVADGWMRTSFSGSVGPHNELIRVDKVVTPNGDGVRIDLGTSVRSNFTLQPLSGSVRGVLRRTFTQVCLPSTWGCRSLMTECEAYVHGKVYWAFHGEIVWHPSLGVRMRGATTAAGGICKPAAAQLVNEDE